MSRDQNGSSPIGAEAYGVQVTKLSPCLLYSGSSRSTGAFHIDIPRNWQNPHNGSLWESQDALSVEQEDL